MTTGRVPSGRRERKMGICGNSILRHLPNHGSLRLHTMMMIIYIYIICACVCVCACVRACVRACVYIYFIFIE